jgi:hypothetical protein
LTLNRFVWPDRGEQPRHIAKIAQRLGCFLVAGSGMSSRWPRTFWQDPAAPNPGQQNASGERKMRPAGIKPTHCPARASHDRPVITDDHLGTQLSQMCVTQRRGGRREPD